MKNIEDAVYDAFAKGNIIIGFKDLFPESWEDHYTFKSFQKGEDALQFLKEKQEEFDKAYMSGEEMEKIIVGLIQNFPDGLRATEVAERIDLPRRNVGRMLKILVDQRKLNVTLDWKLKVNK